MPDVTDLLLSLHRRGIDLWVDQKELRCRAPSGVLTREDLSSLRKLKGEVLHLLGHSGSLASLLQRPTRTASLQQIALTSQQKGMWDSRHELNFVPRVSLRLRGQFDVEIFRKSLTVVMQRHESLRTRIVVLEGEPVQHIDHPRECLLDIHDLSQLTWQEHKAKKLLEEFFETNVNPEYDPLFQLKILKISEDDHVLAIAIHHLIIDGASIGLLLQELWTLYQDIINGQRPSLPEATLQYSDYSAWQRRTQQFWQIKNGHYWSQKLSGVKPTTYPVDNDIQNVSPRAAAAFETSLGDTLSRALHNLSRREGTTTPTLMLAVTIAALSLWCNQDDLSIATIDSGRDMPDLLNLVGFLAHPYYLRIDLSGLLSFRDLLKAVADELRQSLDHLETGMVVGSGLCDAFDTEPPALIQWLTRESEQVLHVRGRSNQSASVLKIESFPVDTQAGTYGKSHSALQVSLFDGPQGIKASGFYRANLFKPTTIDHFLTYIRTLCELLITTPDVRLQSLNAKSR